MSAMTIYPAPTPAESLSGGVRRLPEPTLQDLARRNREQPSISIILATFNSGKLLLHALESIWAQREPLVEILVIDGGSSDGTVPLLKTVNNRIDYWISEPDRGIYDAWNKGVAAARGEWIGFLGSDDELLPGAIRAYREGIRCSSPELEYLSSQIRRCSGRGRMRILGEPWEWSSFRRWMTVAHPGSLHHRSLFAEMGLFQPEYKSAGDYEFLLRAGSRLHAGYLPRVTVAMRAGGISDSTLSLRETYYAQRRTRALGLLPALCERAVATLKFYRRRALAQ